MKTSASGVAQAAVADVSLLFRRDKGRYEEIYSLSQVERYSAIVPEHVNRLWARKVEESPDNISKAAQGARDCAAKWDAAASSGLVRGSIPPEKEDDESLSDEDLHALVECERNAQDRLV